MDTNKLAALRDAINAVLDGAAPAAPAPTVTPVAPTAPVANVWTADKTVRWVDVAGGARNNMGARITDGALDPMGLLAVYAANPGRPVFTAEYPKRGRDKYPTALVVAGLSGAGTPVLRGSLVATPAPAAPAPAPAAPAAAAPAPLMAQWVAAYPEAAATLARILAAGVGREYTYRDILALGGLVPPRKAAAS